MTPVTRTHITSIYRTSFREALAHQRTCEDWQNGTWRRCDDCVRLETLVLAAGTALERSRRVTGGR